MSIDQRISLAEDLMADVLRESKRPLSLKEIVRRIHEKDERVLSGKTPEKSLYSIIYRREKKRADNNHKSLFKTTVKEDSVFYALNNKR